VSHQHVPAEEEPLARLSAEDRLDLQELIARYSLARDDQDMDSLLDCFTSEAVFNRRGQDVTGREALHDFYLASMKKYDLTTHTNHAQVLEPVDVGHAHGVVTGHAELVLSGALIVASYRYHDCYRQERGRWRFASRELRFLYAMPVEELAHGFAGPRRIRWPATEPAPADYPETLPTWGYSQR
jgi:ketosteroid isomerase-like protein